MTVLFCPMNERPPALSPGETHVYACPLDRPEAFLPCITGDEQARAARFRLPRIRNQFVEARGRLRTLLGHYLGIGPQAVPIRYADGGKPYVPSEFGLHFNLSHTDGFAVFAFGRQRVGIDVERARPVPDADDLVARFFSARENAWYHRVPEADRPAAFLRAWTRKEAVLKAIGRGVQSLDCCDVTFGRDEPPQLLLLDGDERAGETWQLFAWEPAAGFIAAGAIENPTTADSRR